MVYIKEAHPDDGWKMPANDRQDIHVLQPKSAEERNKVATTCAAKLALSIPFVVDEIENKVGEAYAGWPDRLYIIDKSGKIAYMGGPGPSGFKVQEMANRLDALLKQDK